MALITINGISFDPIRQAQAFKAAGLEAVDASHSDYLLVQTAAPLSSDQKAELAQLGLVIHEYVAENTYLYGYKGTDLAQIRNLPFVTWANIYMQGFKVAPDLRSAPSALSANILSNVPGTVSSRTPYTVDIVFHEDIDPNNDGVKSAIAAAARVDKTSLTMGRHKVRLTVQEQYLDDLAAIDAVKMIQKVPQARLHNNVAGQILHAWVVENGTTYEGEGQVITVADTGFDTGSTTDTHPAFTGRVRKLYSLGRSDTGLADDPEGHGTHVCGSVLGDGFSDTMGGAIRGTAPRATLVVQSLIGPSGGLPGIPPDLTDLFEPPYRDDGVRVHTNSWGGHIPGETQQHPYGPQANEIDDFVWKHPDLVICFAAGNTGTDNNQDGSIDPAQIEFEPAAKNCITVGASESQRPEIARTYGNIRPHEFPVQPIHGDPMADNPEGMAAFSSRGLTLEGRLKPDVVAPGTSILSTRSRHVQHVTTVFGVSADAAYFFDTGTSMAAPLVAGCAAVLRETLVKNGVATPSAALIKALLINGAVELAGQYQPSEAGSSPNISSGFGRVDLAGSIILPGSHPAAGFREGELFHQDDEDTITVEIPGASPGELSRSDSDSVSTTETGATFKITLAWSDPPGALLQNDLDLLVVAADGSERHGNMGTSSDFDRVNNVEQILWTNIPPGSAKIIIRAFRTTRNSQPYACAWRIS